MADEKTKQMPTMSCNICGAADFGPFANRPSAQCKTCWSLERSRGMMHIIEREGLLKRGMRVLHFAPEWSIGMKIIEAVGRENYDCYDLFPDLFHKSLGVQRFDLTQADLLETDRYDLILHSHILEHIPCYVAVVLWHFHRALKSGGTHLFCMPIMRGCHESDFSDISEVERLRRFGQKDHVRKFGWDDLDKTIGQVFDLNKRTFGLEIDASFAAAHNINPDEIRRTMFLMTQADFLLSGRRFEA